MRSLKLLIIPLLLLFTYFILISYPYFFSKINRHDSLGLLSLIEEDQVNIHQTFSPESRTDKLDNHLLKGEKIVGDVKPSENNFGIVLVRFIQLSAKVTDTVVFRIKEKDKSNWYYENVYRANQFQPNQYFTFGFPSVSSSKNKTYVFEIESLSGTYKNGIGLSQVKPQYASVYKYSTRDLKNYKVLVPFIYKKFIYAVNNINILQNWQILASFVLLSIVIFYKKNILIFLKKSRKLFSNRKFYNEFLNLGKAESRYFSLSKKIVTEFKSINFSLQFLDTDFKKRLAVGLIIFLFALVYRFSFTLVNQDQLFYAGLGGQGDYDQFIRTATCAVTTFCSAILGQNFLLEASILGIFYNLFGFVGALKAYVYFMIILSSVVATLPHFLLSRKNWISLGGIFGGFYLATSDFLTHVSLNYPPDNGSLFTFSVFFVVYLLTIQKSNLRWLILLGLVGLIDALNKALFILNDLVALGLFVPVFFYDKVRENAKPIFAKRNIKILALSLLPFIVFSILYAAWEYFVYYKFSAYYFLRGLIQSKAVSYVSYTTFSDNSISGNIFSSIFYVLVSAIIMIRHLIQYADFNDIILGVIFIPMFVLSFFKNGFPLKKFILMAILSISLFFLLILVRNDYARLNQIFNGEYIYTWTDNIYFGIFLLLEIVFLFILNLRFLSIKLSLPIIFYVVMLVFLAKNSPFPRLHTHVVAWTVILLAFIVDWIFLNISRSKTKVILSVVILSSLIYFYILPKTIYMFSNLSMGLINNKKEVEYLKWVNLSLPDNAVVLGGGKSDLVNIGENINKPVAYNTLWSAAVLIKPKKIPGISPVDFSIVSELQNKENFKKNKYIILEDDISLWRSRMSGIQDNLFSSSLTTLDKSNYLVKVYKYNLDLKKAIYELDFVGPR